RLTDEAMALSFMGGERLIRVRASGEATSKAVKLFLDQLQKNSLTPNALTLIEAGDLKKTNSLRKACEASSLAVTLPCYAEGDKDRTQFIQDQVQTEALGIENDALMALRERLGEDRGITKAEIEKLILYKGPKSLREDGDNQISLADVKACLTDSASDVTFDVIDCALRGQLSELSEGLYRAHMAGVSPIAILRILQGKLLRLVAAQQYVRQGDTTTAAMKKLRPPVFFGEQKSFEMQLRKWPLPALEHAIGDIFEADLAAKRTGHPQTEVIERCLLRLCATAARRG
ncbi:MAG: DNA polymerase III subunit delta, partial [Pseudomonadota bacterium]